MIPSETPCCLDGGREAMFKKEPPLLWEFATMPPTIKKGHRTLVEEAERELENLTVKEALKLHGRDDVQFVDVRDIRELEREGRIPGAFHCPRGVLEFWIDPESPYYKPVFGTEKKFVFFCAGGLRSALSAQTAQAMGLTPVAHIRGGFGEWKKAGAPVDLPDVAPKGPDKTN